ncbi:immunoglobulin-like domain-containing protein [Agarivorans litoreus]|uniref:immunoglobulin-like domain-containing protein n=1 Tax=Agarivorans litoreus TaxID=1510455 RepID=UPI001C7CD2A2|nr:immunoglobulin-like domain-containing protein [Agarivorans litoreus]
MTVTNSKFKLTNAALVAALALALSGCGDTVETESPVTPPPVVIPPEPADPGIDGSAQGIFDNAASEGWAIYNSSDAGLATIVSDADYGDVVQFTIADNGETVAGFTARTTDDGHNAVDGSPYDASGIVDTGTFEFDLKIVTTANADSSARAEMVPWSIKFEDTNGNFAEVPFKILPSTEWQHFRFTLAEIAATLPPEWSDTEQVDLSIVDLMMMYPNWQTAGGLVYVVDNVAIYANSDPVDDTEAPVISLLGDAVINLTNGTAFVDPGYNVTDNVDTDITVIVAGDTVDTAVDGSYVITYNASDAAGNAAEQVTRTVNVSSVDNIAPIISLVGAATITVEVGDDYVDPGATAMDNVDGDITANIVVDDSAVDTSTAGNYVVTYNVLDDAGNEADEVTRQVQVVEPGVSIVRNGDFSSAIGAEWVMDQGSADLTIVNEELVISNFVPGGASWQPRMVQDQISVTPGAQYAIRFDAKAEQARSIVIQAGELLTADPWFKPFMNDQAVSLTTDMTSYELLFTASDNAAQAGHLIFALGAGVATTITLDNVSIDEVMPSEVAPVLTLVGEASMRLTVGDGFTDPGVNATDNLDGDISANVVVTGAVDTAVEGVYTLTYNVMDSDGNEAQPISRTVTVVAGGSNDSLVANGDFSSGALTPWFQVGGGTVTVENGAVKTFAGVGGEARIKQDRIGEGVLTASQVVTVSFDMKGSMTDGGAINGILTTEASAGVSGTEVLALPAPTADWVNHSFDVTIGNNPEWGLALSIGSVCGAVVGCEVTAYFDNFSIAVKE